MNEQNNNSGSHHVAWADRVEYDKLWFRNIQLCDETYGTEQYENSVWRLYYSIINIKDGPQLRDLIDEYLKTVWFPLIDSKVKLWHDRNSFESVDSNLELLERQHIMMEQLPDLCYFIRQLLNDHGYGFYRTRSDSLEEKMY